MVSLVKLNLQTLNNEKMNYKKISDLFFVTTIILMVMAIIDFLIEGLILERPPGIVAISLILSGLISTTLQFIFSILLIDNDDDDE